MPRISESRCQCVGASLFVHLFIEEWSIALLKPLQLVPRLCTCTLLVF